MSDDDRVNRRELRKEIVAVSGVTVALLAPLTTALGFSPLVSIWSILAIVIGFIAVISAIVLHDRESSTPEIGRNIRDRRVPRMAVALLHPFYLSAVVCLLLVSGAWLEANLGNTVNLLLYGSLSDLAVARAAQIAEPATITLRRIGQSTCFFTQANFDVRNATSGGLYLGLISASVDMQDNAGGPVLIPHNAPDLRGQNAFVSGIGVITGPAEGWQSRLAEKKAELTFLRPGQSAGITIRQEEWYQKNCVSDPNGDLMKSYKGSAVRVTAGLAILRPDGSIERQDVRTGDIPALVQRQ